MANGKNRIQYQIGFKPDQSGLKQLKASLQELQKLKFSDIMKINDFDRKKAEGALDEIRKQAGYVEDALREAFNVKLGTTNIDTFNKSLKSAGSSINTVYETFKQGGAVGENAFRSLTSQVLSTNVQLKESHAILDKVATTLGNTIKWNVASSAINMVTRSVQQAWGYVQSLDKSLNNIRIVTGKSADEMANFAVQANNAAKQLGRTTTDYTNAALIYAQQGLSDAEIEERAKITLKAANVTGQSTDAVSQELTAVWNGYKVTAEQAQVYVDRLAAVAATTASNLQELSTGMSKVASAAAAMGVGQDQLAAQLSTIISVTRQAPESVGTALRTVYARISDIEAGIDEEGVSLGNYSGAMAALGFNVLDASGKLRDMGQVIEQIGYKWQSLTREQQISLAQTMAGQRQYSNLLALFENFDKYNKSLETAREAEGTLQEQNEIYLESTAAHFNQLKASMEDVFDSLIDTDSIEGLVDGFSRVADFVASFVDSLGGGVGILQNLGAIGLTVFSDQIGRSINTTITNFEIATQNAAQFDQTLAATQKWQGIPKLSQTTKELLKARESALQLANSMGQQQFKKVQDDLNNTVQAVNKYQEALGKKEQIEQSIQQLARYGKQWQTLEDFLKDDSGRKQVLKDLKDTQKTLSIVSNGLTDFRERIKTIGNQSDGFEVMKAHLQDYLFAIQTLVEDGEMDQHAEQIERLQQEFERLTAEASGQQLRAGLSRIGGQLDGIISKVSTSNQNLIAQVETGWQEFLAQLKDSEKQAQEAMQNTNANIQNAVRATNIKNITDMAGGLAQLARGIQQVQNLGSIWSNNDLSIGQKILQTITSMSFALPMLIKGFTGVSLALGLLSAVEVEEAIAATTATAAQLAHAGAITLTTDAAGAAVIAIRTMHGVILMNPYTAVAAAVLALVAAFGILANVQEKNRQEQIKANKETIEAAQAKQDQIEKNKELYESLEQLNEQFQKGQLSRADLKVKIQELIDQYGLEGEAANRLRENYQNLAEAIRIAREEDALRKKNEAKDELDAASENLQLQLDKEWNNGSDSPNAGLQSYADIDENGNSFYRLTFDQNEQNAEINKVIKKAFNDSEYFNSSGGVNKKGDLTTSYDIEGITGLYTDIEKKYSELGKTLSEEQKEQSKTYKFLGDWLKEHSQWVQPYRDALEKIKEYDVEIQGFSKDIDFGNTENFDQYIAKREQLIEKLKTEKIAQNPEEAIQMADTFLSQNYGNIFKQYSIAAEAFSKGFGNASDEVKKFLETADENAISKALDLADKGIVTSWEQFIDAAKRANNQVKNLENVNFDNLMQSAGENLVSLNSLEEQVRSGKSISPKQLDENIPQQLQQYFTMMANGQYKMTGDAKKFYQTLNNLKLDPFYDAIDSVNLKMKKLEISQSSDFNQLSKTAESKATTIPGGPIIYDYDKEYVQKQLDFLKQVYEGTNTDQEFEIEKYQKSINNLNPEQLEKIRDLVADLADKNKNLTQSQEQLEEESKKAYQALAEATHSLDSDVTEQNLASLTDYYQQNIQSLQIYSKALEENREVAEDVAEAQLRYNDALEDAGKNYQNWVEAVKEMSQTGAIDIEVINQLRDAYADLLDINGDNLSDTFLRSADNLELFKQAVNGSEEAYNQLLDLATQDVIAKIGIDKTQFEDDKQVIYDEIKELTNVDFDKLKIGADIDTKMLDEKLATILEHTNMTASQAEAYLAGMGIDAEVVEAQRTVQDAETYTDAEAQLKQQKWIAEAPVGGQKFEGTIPSVHYNLRKSKSLNEKSQTGFALKVTSAHKSAGGNIKFSSAPSSSKKSAVSGTTPKETKASKTSTPKAAKQSSSSNNQKDTFDNSQKDLKKSLDEEKDIYHDINIEIQKINRDLSRTQKIQDRLYGKQLIDNLNKQTAILQAQKRKLKEKQQLQKQDLANQQAILNSLGVTFDEYGNINDYMSILQAKQNAVNELIATQNDLISQYNSNIDKDTKTVISSQIESYEKSIQEAQQDLKDTQSKMSKYDSLRESMEDIVDEIDEIAQQQVEINIKKFRTEIEIRLEMGEAERNWNDFVRNVINKTDVIKDTGFDKIFKDVNKSLSDINSYFNVNGSIGSLEKLTKQLYNTRDQINSINRTGTSFIYGDNKARAMEDLQNDLSELMNQMKDIESLVDDIDEAYLDTIKDIEESFNTQIDSYNYVSDLIQHNIDLVSLLYGDKNYVAMEKYYIKLEQNQNGQIDMLRKQALFWRKERNQAMDAGDANAAKQFEENYKKAIQNLNSLIEESAETITNKYINAIEKIFDELDKKVSNNKGTDYLSKEWELMNKNGEEYLDTINSAYAIQSLQLKFQDALNNTSQLKQQRSLKQLMDEQLTSLKAKDRLTQYDVDRVEKLLKLQQARMALEDARNNKTSLRLKRDTQGNYSYQYMADQDKINEAQTNLSDARTDLYNFDKQQYQSNLDDMLSAWKDFQNEAKAILEDVSLSEEQRVAKMTLLQEQYGEYINGKTQQNLVIRNNLMDSAFEDIAALYNSDISNYQNMTDEEKNILMGNLVPAWKSGVQDMSDAIAGNGGFIPTCEQAFKEIHTTTKDYENQLDTLANTADVNFDKVGTGVDSLIDEFKGLIDENDNLINTMDEEMFAIQELRNHAQDLVNEYNNVYYSAVQAVSQLYNFIQAQQQVAASYQNAGTAYQEMRVRMEDADATYADQAATNAEAAAQRAMDNINHLADIANQKMQDTANQAIQAAETIADAFNQAQDFVDKTQDLADKAINTVNSIPPYMENYVSLHGGADIADSIRQGRAAETNYRYLNKTGQNTFDTGGYTGNWHSSEGKIAILHEKQLVLNKEDTKNILDTVSILRNVSSNINNLLYMRSSVLNNANLNIPNFINNNKTIDQNVHISASFPNINSKREIEEAFNDLVNLAAQRSMRK